MINDGRMTDAECFVERTKLVHEYRKFLFLDPGLPKELLPEMWSGDARIAIIREVLYITCRTSESIFSKKYLQKITI